MEWSYQEDGDYFFDAREEISSLSDGNSDDSDCCCSSSRDVDSFGFGVWSRHPETVWDRKARFLRWMELSLDWNSMEREDSESETYSHKMTFHEIMDDENAFEGFSAVELRQSITFHTEELSDTCVVCKVDNSCRSRSSSFEDGHKLVADEMFHNKQHTKVHQVDSTDLVGIESLWRKEPSPSICPLVLQKVEGAMDSIDTRRKSRKGWFRRLGLPACVSHRYEDALFKPDFLELPTCSRMQKLHVYSLKKKYKELSALYGGQDFLAHNGPILTMKFSVDGQYLATAGKDCVVRVWKVAGDERLDKFGIPDDDSSFVYINLNESSKQTNQNTDKELMGKMKTVGRSSNLSYVVLPCKLFQILESPLHEFQGHTAEVLDVSWSKKGYLLSSSVDKTVRLWQIGCKECLGVFYHNNYVTSISFNPMDDKSFISGSIDGKVRIWKVAVNRHSHSHWHRHHRLVDYIDIREIVSAVCYRPDGKGAIVGTMNGNCRFYDIVGNHLQLDAQISIHGKKKSPGKKITGFQYSPGDPSKVMVTSADSSVRILSGVDVICKLKGFRGAGVHRLASFSSDGKHIISAGEDSHVYVWNYASQDKVPSKPHKIRSLESFYSDNASLAISWWGIRTRQGTITPSSHDGHSQISMNEANDLLDLDPKIPSSSPDCFSIGRGFLSELLPKGSATRPEEKFSGSATWPEEKLSDSSPMAVSPTKLKFDYKAWKNGFHSTLNSPHMWGSVIVTAGWDGRIRTYHNYGIPMRT